MSQPRILALDTTTEACSAALSAGREAYNCYEVIPRGHARRLLPMIDELMSRARLELAELDAIAYCRGPGSFTGIRIAAGVVQGLAYGSNRPVIPVSTLACLAQGSYREHGADAVLAAIDARMDEVYWGAYRLGTDGIMLAVDRETVGSPDRVFLPPGIGAWFGAGTGWGLHESRLVARCGRPAGGIDGERLPDARDCLAIALRLYRTGAVADARQALPIYLRNRVTS